MQSNVAWNSKNAQAKETGSKVGDREHSRCLCVPALLCLLVCVESSQHTRKGKKKRESPSRRDMEGMGKKRRGKGGEKMNETSFISPFVCPCGPWG
mmetsp:Transcript_26214/g.51478  ORF Transcript_26214/g.51478 Transcript_26214/m.51478 type:complete len:96 (+) Transcript_26214:1216-1503(+)